MAQSARFSIKNSGNPLMSAVNKKFVIRRLPLAFIFCGLFCFFYFHLDTYINFETLKEHRQFLSAWTQEHYSLAVCLYMISYVATILCAIPSSIFFSLTAGFLFGSIFGFLYTMVSAIIGAAIFFLLIRTALAEWLAEKLGKKLQHFEAGFQENAFNYILTMRLIPIFPFFIVNIASAILGVRLFSFLAATFLGIIPANMIYVSLGHGLGKIFDHHQTPNIEIIFQPHIFIPLILMAVLALLPVVYKKLFVKFKYHKTEQRT
jgi:uncharacterized membrane protein YdjX (TVP38/TMEM64 family)